MASNIGIENKKAIALTSDIDKETYNTGKQIWIIYPELFQKINEKIEGKAGNQRTLLFYLIFQQQNGTFRPAEETICKYCAMPHARYNEARKALNEKGYITYIPNEKIQINYKKIME